MSPRNGSLQVGKIRGEILGQQHFHVRGRRQPGPVAGNDSGLGTEIESTESSTEVANEVVAADEPGIFVGAGLYAGITGIEVLAQTQAYAGALELGVVVGFAKTVGLTAQVIGGNRQFGLVFKGAGKRNGTQ